jgi:hypothetical protein
MSKIVSFGDSFIFGYEIPENYDGSGGWPGIAAQRLDLDFECKASPGSSNSSICRKILDYYSDDNNLDDIAIINWTWSHRWSYFVNNYNLNTWINFGPSIKNKPFLELQEIENIDLKNNNHSELFMEKINSLGKPLVNTNTYYQQRLQKMYIEYISDNEMMNKFNSLQSIYCATAFLLNKGIKFVQTNMDSELFETRWFCDGYIQELQNFILPNMHSFNKLNFLDWSRKNKFKITDPGWHPLEDAHNAAGEYWLPTYKQLLDLN